MKTALILGINGMDGSQVTPTYGFVRMLKDLTIAALDRVNTEIIDRDELEVDIVALCIDKRHNFNPKRGKASTYFYAIIKSRIIGRLHSDSRHQYRINYYNGRH